MSVTGLGEIFDFGSKIIDKIFPDKQAADAAKIKLLEMQQNGELAALEAYKAQDAAQANINAAEAQSSSLFVAGWRPALGWICAVSFAYAFILQPLLAWAIELIHPGVVIPEFPIGILRDLTYAMLGLGGLRTFEKIKGVASR